MLMLGPYGVADHAETLMEERLAVKLRQVERDNPKLMPGQLGYPALITSTEPKWPLGTDQQPAVILSVRNAGSSVLQEVTSEYELWDVTYEVAAEVYLTLADPKQADIQRYSWILAIRHVWLSARAYKGFDVQPGFAETYDTVTESVPNAEWVSRALCVVQVVVPEKRVTASVEDGTLTPVDVLGVKAGYVGSNEELNVPIHPALDDSDSTPATIAP